MSMIAGSELKRVSRVRGLVKVVGVVGYWVGGCCWVLGLSLMKV